MADNPNPMTEKQLELIRQLFKAISPHLSEDDRKDIINKMRASKDTMTKKEASNVIDAFIKVRTDINLRIAKERRAANSNK